MHNVTIHDDNENWVRWGQLVVDWIKKTKTWPTTVPELREAMTKAGVNGDVEGDDTRAVTLVQYGDAPDPIIIPLPTSDMIDFDKGFLSEIAQNKEAKRHYPLPVFYSVVFGGAAMVDLCECQLHDMMLRRLGEYVINECM